jgi:DNA-binding response OmpR family regulator
LASRKHRVLLIIEPGETSLSSRKLLVESAGYNALSAVGAQQGLDLLKEHKIDLAILDVECRDMPLNEFIRAARERYPKLPIFALSPDPEAPDEIKGQVQGVVERMSDPKRLVAQVEEFLHDKDERPGFGLF